MKDKLIRLTIAVISGGFIAVYSPREARIIILAFFILLLARLWLLWKPKDFLGRFSKPEVLILVCSIVIGYLYGMTGDRLIASPLLIGKIEVEGKLKDWVIDDSGGRGTFIVQNVLKLTTGVEATKTTELTETTELAETTGALKKLTATEMTETLAGRKYSLRVYPDKGGVLREGWDKVKPGDRLRLGGRLEHPKPPGSAGEFHFPLYNAVRGLSGTISARGEVLLLEEGTPGITWKIRKIVREVLDEHWPAEAGVLEGILFGDSSRISPETLERYKAAGVMHVFAASGANVAFVMALVWGIFFFLPRKVRILAVIGIIMLYAALCRGNPPILRATILAAAVLAGMLGRGRVPSLRWLMFAAFILFIFNPLYLRDISFQLSFAAAWGMIAVSPQLEKISWVSRFPQVLRRAAAVSFGVQIAAFPILIAVFHRVSLVGLITNIFMLFILGAVLQLGLLGASLILVPLLPLLFFQVAFWLLQISDCILSFLAAFSLAYFWVLNPGILFWMVWYSTLGILLFGKEKAWFILKVQWRKLGRFIDQIWNWDKDKGFRHRVQSFTPCRRGWGLSFKNTTVLFCFLVSLLLLLLLWSPFTGNDRLEITFLDVGQGDCILIQTPKETLLVDSGPRSDRFDAGERIVVPYLMEKRIGYLDMVFITHEDSDHLGGARYLLANIPAGRVAVPEVGERLGNEAWQEGLPPEVFHSPGKLVRLKAGDKLGFSSGLTIELLAPVTTITGTTGDSNNNSLVFVLDYLGQKVLFTGDMGLEEMEQILDRGANWDADFIKLPHHGSKGSLNLFWFDQTNPRAVFIQVGRNSFGHPASEVIRYWQEREIPIFRTDTQGTIRLVIDQQEFSIIPGRD